MAKKLDPNLKHSLDKLRGVCRLCDKVEKAMKDNAIEILASGVSFHDKLSQAEFALQGILKVIEDGPTGNGNSEAEDIVERLKQPAKLSLAGQGDPALRTMLLHGAR